MAQSIAHIYLHIIFSTKERTPYLDPKIEPNLYQYIKTICADLDSPLIAIGGNVDHIHLLCSLSKSITLSSLIKTIKSKSSHWIKRQDQSFQNFYWQRGYAAFSVSPYNYQKLILYIKNQKEHHKDYSLQEELKQFNLKL
ncbi:IS200/IS605 family transposase [Saprospira sp. CCB-QB6]|uniref:IS200/IS605 family transposase n=1 Tax=Saprospira sp. CCB-QB6 TaxID=3023936 RepID=UPI002349E2E8|nr:IS200/IS605 family transposase [Saprospira sp. CCB-QB6]WCL81309.1 IS200/IS605 family transposase [Saprospira sp. CCB-QB6]